MLKAKLNSAVWTAYCYFKLRLRESCEGSKQNFLINSDCSKYLQQTNSYFLETLILNYLHIITLWYILHE